MYLFKRKLTLIRYIHYVEEDHRLLTCSGEQKKEQPFIAIV